MLFPKAALSAPDSTSLTSIELASKKKTRHHLAEATMVATLKAPIEHTWQTLVDFDKYPDIFHRIKSIAITKREGNLVYIESYLRPHMFVRTEIQHTVNDIGGKPEVLKWHVIDGNFRYVEGAWHLKTLSANTTQLTYWLAVDPGPVVPAGLVSFVLHFVQREIVSSFVQYTELSFQSNQSNKNLIAK